MANNHLCYLHRHHILRHRSRIFLYFDFENMKFLKDSIKGVAKKKMDNIEVKMKEVMESNRKSLETEKNKRADTII